MEKTVLLSHGDLKINCKWFAPDEGPVRRIVLGVAGIGGTTEDPIQVGIAQEMEMYYSATFRFDFPGHGASPMDSEHDLTLENCLATLATVAAYAREQYPEVEDLCIFATGFGAYITLIALQQLQELPGKVKLVIQTPSLRVHQALLAMKGISEPTLCAMDKMTFDSNKAKRPLDITYSFYTQLRANDVFTTYPIPMLILMGEEDAYIPRRDVENFRRINPMSKLVTIPGVKHRFMEEGAWDMVLDLTRDWFEYEQVLLCDYE